MYRETTAVVKTLFLSKEKRHFCKNYLLYILFLMRNDLVIKLFHILRITALDIHLSIVAAILMFVQLFTITWYHMVFWCDLLIGEYVYIFIAENNWPRHEKLFYITSVFTIFVHYTEKIGVSKENLCYYFGM